MQEFQDLFFSTNITAIRLRKNSKAPKLETRVM
jgi:hypothetical protein